MYIHVINYLHNDIIYVLVCVVVATAGAFWPVNVLFFFIAAARAFVLVNIVKQRHNDEQYYLYILRQCLLLMSFLPHVMQKPCRFSLRT